MKRTAFLAVLLMAMATALFAQNAESPRLAVVEFNVNISNEKTKADAITVRNLVESNMVATRKYRIITRDEIDKLLVEQKIQVSSISSAESITKLQLQKISYIVTGSVDAMGDNYAITVRVLDVSNGQYSHSADDFMGGSPQALYDGIKSLMTKFVAGMSSEGGRVTQNESGKTYKVGDTGPGGGIVFSVEGNTGLEVSRLLGDYTWDEAIRVAKDYRGGGFTDWHLPSRGELDLIYQNLQKAKIVNLGTGWYWSSSQSSYSYAWVQAFSDGYQYGSNKSNAHSVRAVRAF